MKRKVLGSFVLLFVLMVSVNVNATIKCGEGKPGDTVSCVLSGVEAAGNTDRIKADNGLKFVGCNICNDKTYNLTKDQEATFNFKIDSGITESKTLNVTIAGNTGSIKVNSTTTTTTTDPNVVTYTVTLVPGRNNNNITKTCTVNSLNDTCNVTLDNLEDSNFNGWGDNKNCTEGSKGNIKVNKDITYYACYTNSSDDNLLLKSLVVKDGDKELDFDFSIRTREYDLIVGLDVDSLEIEAEAQSDDVEINISGNENLKEGDNKIIITLTDKDGATSTYTLNVKKEEKIEAPLLNMLSIRGYNNFNFSSDIFVYDLTIDRNIKSLIIEYETENDNQNVEIEDNENLHDGSKIKIIVTDKDTDLSSTYEINIHMESSNLIIYIIIGAALLIILIILLIIVIKKGKKKQNNDKSSKKNVKNNSVKGKKAVSTIPEVKETPVAPQAPIDTKKKEEVETLDF